jgi:hypothetical protein
MLSAYLSVGASLRVAVRNRWGGLVTFALAVNVTSPPVASAAQLDSVATTALNVLARAQGSGDVNVASQAAAPLLQILAASSQTNASTAAQNETRTQQRADIRSQLFAASMAIIAQSSGSTNSSTTGASTGPSSSSSSSPSLDAVAQSVALIASIVTVAADRATEVSGAVAAGGSAFAAQTAQSALASSAAPFTPALALGLVNIASACVMASAANATAAASGNSGADRASPSQQQQQQQQQQNAAQLQVTRAAAAATESVARGLLIGALVGQQPPAVSAGLIALTASRRGVDATTGLVQGDLAFALPSASNGEAGNDGSAGSSGTGPSLSSSMAGAGLIGVQVPPSVLADSLGSSSGAAVVDATLVTFSSDIYALSASSSAAAGNAGSDKDNSKRSLPSSAPVVSFTLYDGGAARNGAGANALPIRNLKSSAPVLITIPRGANEMNRSDTQCQFWNTVPFVVLI